MNSCRLGVHFWPTRVRKSIAYSHSAKVRSVLRTKPCNDFTNSSIRNLIRGFFTSSKLWMTAAVSSVSLNWGIFACPWGLCLLMATLHQRAYQGKRDAIGTPRRFRLSRLESAALFQEMKPDASSSHSLPRIRRHVESRLRPDRETSARTLHRGRPLSGSPAHGPSARPTRPPLAAGLCGYRAQNPGQGRHHLPHLLHDQADHEHCLHDAGRGRPRRARRARPQIYPGMEKPRRVPGRHMASLSHPAAVAADADRRSDAAHLGPHLRLPAARQCGCGLSRD